MSFMDLIEIIDRAQEGPSCTEKEWDMRILPKLARDKTKEYAIRYGPQELIPSDDTLIDNVFKAGLELAIEAGVLCTSTERRILFTESELKEALREAPAQLSVGQDRDSVTISHRMPEDNKPIVNFFGPIGVPVSEELFRPICYSYTRESITDIFDGPTLDTIHGRRIRAGTPLEAIAAREDMMMAREACIRAGKKSLCIAGVESSPTYLGHISAGTPQYGLYPTDLQICAFLSELKTNWGQLNKIAHTLAMGGIVNGGMHPMIGGYVGGPAEAAITLVAASILAVAVHSAQVLGHYAHDFRFQGNTGRESIWAESLGHQALARNTHLLHGGGSSPVAGCCTPMLLYETAATTIACSVSGESIVIGVRTGKGILRNNCSGLEARLSGELTRIIPELKLKREEANEIVVNLVSKYEDKLTNPPSGKDFPNCYNVSTCMPSSEWINIYRKIRRELEVVGIDFSF